MTPRTAAVLLAVIAVLGLAGCGARAGTSTGTGASKGSAKPAGSAPSSQDNTPVKAAAPDAAACKRMDAHPKFTTVAQAHAYVAFLGRQITAATSQRLNNAIELVRADLEAVLLGAGNKTQTLHDAARLQAVCTSYGVRGPG